MNEASAVVRTDREQCAILTLNRPARLNAISNEMVDELERALDAIERDESRVLIFTGSGRAFCAGTDLSAHANDTMARMKRMHRLVLRLQEFPKPSFAAVNGICFGGGLEVALGCTFRVAGPSAKLGLPEIKLGLMPLYGGTALLPALVGKNRALELMLSGDPIDAKRACEIGLVNAISASDASLLDDTCAYAMRMGQHSRIPREALRRLIREHGEHATLRESLEAEVAACGPVIDSEDAHEGVEAFLQKRKAAVRDR
jgi:enoyl-CoA hydratase